MERNIFLYLILYYKPASIVRHHAWWVSEFCLCAEIVFYERVSVYQLLLLSTERGAGR